MCHLSFQYNWVINLKINFPFSPCIFVSFLCGTSIQYYHILLSPFQVNFASIYYRKHARISAFECRRGTYKYQFYHLRDSTDCRNQIFCSFSWISQLHDERFMVTPSTGNFNMPVIRNYFLLRMNESSIFLPLMVRILLHYLHLSYQDLCI